MKYWNKYKGTCIYWLRWSSSSSNWKRDPCHWRSSELQFQWRSITFRIDEVSLTVNEFVFRARKLLISPNRRNVYLLPNECLVPTKWNCTKYQRKLALGFPQAAGLQLAIFHRYSKKFSTVFYSLLYYLCKVLYVNFPVTFLFIDARETQPWITVMIQPGVFNSLKSKHFAFSTIMTPFSSIVSWSPVIAIPLIPGEF